MLIRLSRSDVHASTLMGTDTVKLCEMQGFPPRLENDKQSRVEANILGFKAEFAVARLYDLEPPTVNVVTDGGVDLWMGDLSIDVKLTNRQGGPLIFDSMEKFKADCAVLVSRTFQHDVMRVEGCISRSKFEELAKKKDFKYGERLYMESKDLYSPQWLWRQGALLKFKIEEEE